MKRIVFATSSNFKIQEHQIFCEKKYFEGKPVNQVFDLEVMNVEIPEILEVDLTKMVEHEVKLAYKQLKVPCFVEHAGLIFEEFLAGGYPGGLTKPMYNALGTEFISGTHSKGKKAIARAVIGYCDGKEIKHFIGETLGIISNEPKGEREFYWDTIFIPDGQKDNLKKTYAQIVKNDGLDSKVLNFSQSTKAKLAFLNSIHNQQLSDLWK